MHECEKVVVIADVSPISAAQLSDLFSKYGYETKAIVQTGREAVRALDKYRPDAIALDAVLPELDGTAAAEQILAAPVSVRPALFLLRLPGFPIRQMEKLCAGGCVVLDKPVLAESLEAALEETDLRVRRVSPEVLDCLDRLLGRLGVPEREGRSFLQTAILYAYQDARLLRRLTGKLYPMVAERYGVDAQKVERDMRRTIELAWKCGKIDEQYAIFGGTIDAQRGKPTCGEMIAQLADILRLEG